ncbi:hypothetical protein B7486_58000 [cyanobacterium TDX16]|nr:hypothetical protein B7486_58000 [cyanobacterium TDX16]
MAYRHEGTVFYAGRNLAALLPWRQDAKEDKALRVAKLRAEDITRDEINDLGVDRPFTPDRVARIDRVLGVSDQLLAGERHDDPTADDSRSAPEQEVPGAAPVG